MKRIISLLPLIWSHLALLPPLQPGRNAPSDLFSLADARVREGRIKSNMFLLLNSRTPPRNKKKNLHLGMFASAGSCEVPSTAAAVTDDVTFQKTHEISRSFSKIHFHLQLMCLKYHREKASFLKKKPLLKSADTHIFRPGTGKEAPLVFGEGVPAVEWNGFKRHFHSGRRASTEFPKANSLWQPGVGSDQPPVILFLHMASSVKPSLRIPAAPAIGPSAAITAVGPQLSVN